MFRIDCWYNMVFCYCGVGEDDVVLNLFWKFLSLVERLDDVVVLFLVVRICVVRIDFVVEGVGYVQRVLEYLFFEFMYMKSCVFYILGVLFGIQVWFVLLDFERGKF